MSRPTELTRLLVDALYEAAKEIGDGTLEASVTEMYEGFDDQDKEILHLTALKFKEKLHGSTT